MSDPIAAPASAHPAAGERLDLADIVDACHDLHLPCEANRHHPTAAVTGVDEPAAWVVWQLQCCPRRRPAALICQPCLAHFLRLEHPIRCRDCGYSLPLGRLWIVRFERIDKPPTGNPPAGS